MNNIDILSSHITNFHIQKDVSNYNKKDDQINGIPIRMLWDDILHYLYLNNHTFKISLYQKYSESKYNNANDTFNHFKQLINYDIKMLLHQVLHIISHKLYQDITKVDQFALLGIDIIYNQQAIPYIIEFTKGPGFRFQPKHLANLHYNLLNETIAIINEIDYKRIKSR